MTIKEALEMLQKEYNCRTDKEYVCGSFDTCDECKYYTSGESFTEALKTVLDAFGNGSEIPNSSDCILRPTDEAAFWKKRAKEYSDMVNDLVFKIVKGVKFDTIVMNEEGFTFKQAEQHRTPCKKELPNSSDLVSSSYLLAEYDRQHQGPPGGARKIIEEAPGVLASTSQTKLKPCDKFILEIGEKQVGIDEYSIVGTDLYVWEGLLEKLTPYESVQTERKKGKWIPVDEPTINGRCSVCGFESHLWEDDVYGYDYCPNCGARLEVIDDE